MTLKTAQGTLALLALEDSAPDVLFERLPGASVPLWPDVRTGFMNALQLHDFGSRPVDAAPEARVNAYLRLGRALLPSRWDARQIRTPRAAAYLMSGVTTHVVDGRLRNWLVGDFADQYPESSAILQWSAVGSPPPAFPLTRSLDPMETRTAGYSRLSRTAVDTVKVTSLVREFATLLDARITPDQVESIAASAVYLASQARHLESQFSRLLDRLSPRVVLMEDASYGGRSALVAMMKARGILVAEPQHGWIGPTHAAYNFGAAMRAPELFATLPDELLTFGEYWGEGIRHPGQSVTIGKAHLEAMAGSAPAWDSRPREVLLVSSVIDPPAAIEFGLQLRAALPKEWVIRFRPHPSERATLATRYAGMFSNTGIELDDNSDVYDSLASARGVVGASSTVLFEALAMGCRVFVKDSQFTDYYTGELFGHVIRGIDDVHTVAEGLAQETWESSRSLESVWKSGAVDNFRAWIDSRVSGLR